MGAVEGEPKGSITLYVSFLFLTLFISGSAVRECQQSATASGSFLSPYWSYHHCQAAQQSCEMGRPLRNWSVCQTSVTCCAILCASAWHLQFKPPSPKCFIPWINYFARNVLAVEQSLSLQEGSIGLNLFRALPFLLIFPLISPQWPQGLRKTLFFCPLSYPLFLNHPPELKPAREKRWVTQNNAVAWWDGDILFSSTHAKSSCQLLYSTAGRKLKPLYSSSLNNKVFKELKSTLSGLQDLCEINRGRGGRGIKNTLF